MTNQSATQRFIGECRDLCLELQIQTAGQQMKIATLLLLEHGCDYFSLAGERDFWRTGGYQQSSE